MSSSDGDAEEPAPADNAEGAERPRRIDASEILENALEGLTVVTGELATALLAELGRSAANRAERIQEAIERADHG